MFGEALRRWRARTSAAGLVLVVVLGLGCQTPQRQLSHEELISRKPELLATAESEIQRVQQADERRIEAELRAASREPGATRQSQDILVLSGGGAFGAFGAGFLDGWGSVVDPELARPHFDHVSGISTGALIAPFAFVGSPAAYEALVEEYENPGENWVRRRGLIPFLPGNVSLYDVSELRRHLRESITPELVAGLAEGGADDRVLVVGATSVDYGILRIWDVARIARQSSVDEAAEEIATILHASSAIPGAFPPVELDDLLYVDGAAAMQVVGGLDDRSWLYGSGDPDGEAELDGPPIRVRVWVIVNQKLRPDPKVTRSRWTSIATRSLNILLRTSLLESIQDAETYVAFIDGRAEYDAELRYVAIPQDFEIPDSDSMFDAETMRALVELGRRMGSDPASWRTQAVRPGAPFPID